MTVAKLKQERAGAGAAITYADAATQTSAEEQTILLPCVACPCAVALLCSFAAVARVSTAAAPPPAPGTESSAFARNNSEMRPSHLLVNQHVCQCVLSLYSFLYNDCVSLSLGKQRRCALFPRAPTAALIAFIKA